MMNDLLNENAWKEAAETLNMSEADIKEKLLAVNENDAIEIKGIPQKLSLTDEENEVTIPFEISFYKVLAVKGAAVFKGGENWSVSVSVSLYALGNEIRKESFQFDKNSFETCFGLSIALAYFNLCFGVRSNHICFYIKGEVGVFLPFKGWVKAKVDENIVCFKP